MMNQGRDMDRRTTQLAIAACVFSLAASLGGCGLLDTAASVSDASHTEELRAWARQGAGRKLFVFVHGYSSSSEVWGRLPELMKADPRFDGSDIFLFGYRTEICRNPGGIRHQGAFLKSFLTSNAAGYGSVVLIGHSLGGLVIVASLLDLERDNPSAFASQDFSVLTFGTPFDGVKEAGIAGALMFCRDQQARDAELLSEPLYELKMDFAGHFNRPPTPDGRRFPQVPVRNFYGAEDLFVKKQTACLASTASCEQVDGNHHTMVALASRDHLTYQKIACAADERCAHRGERASPALRPKEKEVLALGVDMRRAFRDAIEAELPMPDFSRVETDLKVLGTLDPASGALQYYSGEVRRVRALRRANVRGCPTEAVPRGLLETYQDYFYRYLELEERVPDAERLGRIDADVCYERPGGFCRQRTGWIHHLLANDFYLMAQKSADAATRRSYLMRSLSHAAKARDNFPPGFTQCTPTEVLEGKVKAELEKAR